MSDTQTELVPTVPASCGCRVSGIDGFVYLCPTHDVSRLTAENGALAAALADVAGIQPELGEPFTSYAECLGMNHVCHVEWPDDPESWCPVCVAEVAWCAWKLGVLA